MDITSIGFLVFVGINLLIYWNLPGKYKWILLLLDSTVFYFLSATPYTVIYLIASIMSVYFATMYFKKTDLNKDLPYDIKNKKKKSVLIFAIILNVGILAVLQYSNLAINTFNYFAGFFGIYLNEVNWLAPLAISFYTLQILSYMLDCYWGIITPQTNVFKLALFTSYFPQMISGPISRYSEIGNQLYQPNKFEYKRVTSGLKRIAWGLLKKLAISNRLAVIVSEMWDNPETFSGVYVWIASLIFVFQLYTDFSGCMDIVLGVSECFGITLPENFKSPLFSRTIQEFWQRWHITLGGWLRDYIMNPLSKSDFMISFGSKCKKKFGKKKGKQIPVFLSMLVVWLLMGLWHGDSWKYILGEGLWFWFAIVCGKIFEPAFKKCKSKLHINDTKLYWKIFQVIRTIIIYTFGMIFFHASSLSDSLYRIGQTFVPATNISVLRQFISLLHTGDIGGTIGFLILALSFIMVFVVDLKAYINKNTFDKFFENHRITKWIAYYLIVTLIVMSMNIGQQEFLYAQF